MPPRLRPLHPLALLLALALALAGAGCGGGGARTGPGAGLEGTPATCADGLDNDRDGDSDCHDADCAGVGVCGAPPADAGGRDAAPLPDAGPSTCTAPIDLVFVVDVSTSMEDEVASIRAGIDSIWNAAEAIVSDVQISLVVFVDDVAAVNGCAPFESIASLQSELMDWQTFTSSNGQPGGSGSSNSDCAENSLDAIWTAASLCPWRAGATRILIHVTDDTFVEWPSLLSEGFLGGGIPVQHTYDQVVEALQSREIRVGAFAAPGAGEACGAGTSSNVGQGFHEPFGTQPALPVATGGRAFDIRAVRAGTLDMAEAINALVADEYCTLY